jgi:hypothetical protein
VKFIFHRAILWFKLEKVADSLEKVLKKDEGTPLHFIGASSPCLPFRLFTQYALLKITLNLQLTTKSNKLQKNTE